MRNGFPWLSGPLLLLLTGCGSTPEHSNTLIFATTTKLALDVSVTPTGSPDFTLGYKRTEGVWMPLLANKKTDGKAEPAPCTGNDCLFQGQSDTSRKDTYSVFASFGADFSGTSQVQETSGASVNAAGGLAQFFATGIAAQNISSKDPDKMVSVQPSDERVLAEAQKRAAAAESQSKQLQELLGDKYQGIVEKREGEIKGRGEQKACLLKSLAPNDQLNETAWKVLVSKADVANKDALMALDLAKIKSELDTDQAFTESKLIEPLFKTYKEGGGKCP